MALPPGEWNFADVPDDELAACCVWEYARESKFLRDVFGQFAKFARYRSGDENDYPKIDESAWGLFRTTVFDDLQLLLLIELNRVSIDGKRIKHDSPILQLIAQWPASWQSIDSNKRRLSKGWIVRNKRPPGPFERRFTPSFSERVEKQARERREAEDKCNAAGNAAMAKKDWAETARQFYKRLPPLNASVCDEHSEVLALRIFWPRYTNDQLVEAFRKWVTDNRPPQLPPPTAKRGPGLGPSHRRVMLRDLGIMRLTNFSTVANMKNRCPEAWTLYRDRKRWKDANWSLARKSALRNFRVLLPSLPKDELPIHAKTKGGRGRLPT